MKDLDFDELDKAVNSLTSEQQKKPEEMNVNAQSGPSTHPEALLLSSNPDIPIEDPELAKVADANPRPHPVVPSMPNRRNGHLDFKRPSFGVPRGVIDIMAPKPMTSSPSAPVRPPSRVAATLHPIVDSNAPASRPAPTSETIAQPPEADVSDEAKLKSVENEIAQVVQVKETTPGEEKWPDPLDFHLDVKEEEQNSPFLPDAKVAKRPLGAYAEYTPPADNAQPTVDIAPLAPEIKKSNAEVVDKPVETKTATQPTKEEAPLPIAPIHEKETHEPAPLPVEQQVRDSAMLSIPQQYRTADKPADIAPRPVFDTKEYHPPLLEDISETSRRGKMWLKLIIVLIVLAVIGVGGYFVFINFVQH